MRNAIPAAVLASLSPLAMAQTTTPVPTPAPAAAPAYDAATAKRAVTKLAQELIDNFVFPETGRKYADALRAKLAAGGYDGIADAAELARVVTADLQAVAPDGHLAMFPPRGDAPAPGQPAAARPAGQPAMPPAMEQAGWIAQDIAFVRFNVFFGQPDVLKAFTDFLDKHAGAKALIIDARTHRGGGLQEMDILFSRIFDKPQTVMVMDTRASVARQDGGRLPFASLVKVDAPPELYRAEHRVVPAKPASPWQKTRIYYLTSGRTGSAAEHLASVFKGTKRGTLIGATTGGAGHYGGTVPLEGGYSAFIPVGRSYFPGDTGWEGVGVAPDIAVAPERALVEALVREGVPAAEAETLSEAHKPRESMQPRRPRRP